MSEEATKVVSEDGTPTHVPSSKPIPGAERIAEELGLVQKKSEEKGSGAPDASEIINNYVRELDQEFTPRLDDMIAQARQTTDSFREQPSAQPKGGEPEKEVPEEGAGVHEFKSAERAKPAVTESEEIKTLKAQIESLQGMLALQMSGGGGSDLMSLIPVLAGGGKLDPNVLTLLMASKAKPPEAPAEPQGGAPAVSEAAPFKVQDVFGGEAEVDLSQPETMNKLLNHVIQTAVERTMLSIPDIVTKKMSHELAARKQAEDWYQKNPDLEPYRKYIATLGDNLSAQYPAATFDQILSILGPLARQTLGLKPPTGNEATPANDTPGIGTRAPVVRRPEPVSERDSQRRQVQHLVLRGTT